MVSIRVFIPHMDMKDVFEEVAKSLPQYEDVKIEMCYIFGTPDYLTRNWEDDILVARGMTYYKLRESFPTKHLVQLKINSFDITDALIQCRREGYHHIGLFVTDVEPHDIEMMEEVCEAKISVFSVGDEKSSRLGIEEAISRGAEVMVGAGTVCGICDKMGIPRIHIRTMYTAIEGALMEALNAAVTMNRERETNRIIRSVFNNSVSGLIAVDVHGNVRIMNNQIYRMFKLSTFHEFAGRNITEVLPSAIWKDIGFDFHSEVERICIIDNKNYFIHIKPYVEDDESSGALVTLQNTDRIIQEETKVRQELSKKGLTAKYHFTDIVGHSAVIQDDIRMAERYSKVNSNILIMGETGTGKELFAHSIHNASLRANEPFVAINCAALPENLLESELFGYEPGAFSGASKTGKMGLFEQAHRGTIFLDEIGEMPISLQAKLLRVLQEKEVRRIGSTSVHTVDVRVISATNVNLESEIAKGNFRSDLYYRLDLLDIHIPPLRERKEDIEELFSAFMSRTATDMGRKVPHITPDAAIMLKQYDWKGNVREMRNVCERLIVLNDQDIVDADTLRMLNIFRMTAPSAAPAEMAAGMQETSYPWPAAGGYAAIDHQTGKKKNKTEQAKEMGISRTTLWRRSKKESSTKA